MLKQSTESVECPVKSEVEEMRNLMRGLQADCGEVETHARLAGWESEKLRGSIVLLRYQLRCLRRNLRNLRLE
jgi:hypothetical protein